MPTTFRCPVGHEFQNSNTFVGITVTGSAGHNVSIACPVCGIQFDAAPVDGTYSTVGGRWTRVADYIAQASTDELAALRDELVQLQAEVDEVKAATRLESLGFATPTGGWWSNQANRTELWQLLGTIIAVLALVLMIREGGDDAPPTAPEIQEIFHQELEHHQNQAPRKVGRNQLCPCGSGQKYKRCHGAPAQR